MKKLIAKIIYKMLFDKHSKLFNLNFSKKFNEIKQNEQQNRIDITKQVFDNYYNFYDVLGAGKIIIGKSCLSQTGKVEGFNFAVSWSEIPYVGGVLDKKEAIKLAKYIIEKTNKNENSNS